MSTASPHVIALIHGIRTHAAWAEMVKAVVEEHSVEVVVEPIRYGYFDVFRFLMPLGTRGGPIARVERALRSISAHYPGSRLSIVAHSYGTYIITQLLQRDAYLRLDRLILCGSVVQTGFDWDRVAHQIASPKVLNECGTEDIWPVFASGCSVGYGASGTVGFGHPKVRDRFHQLVHSAFFDEAFVKEYWLPYLLRGDIKGTAWERRRPTAPWWQSVLASRVPATLVLLCAMVVLFLNLPSLGGRLRGGPTGSDIQAPSPRTEPTNAQGRPATSPSGSAPTPDVVSTRPIGYISGTVLYRGSPPAAETIRMRVTDPFCAERHDGGVLMREKLQLQGNALGGVLVYLKGEFGDLKPTAEPVLLDQRGCEYFPRVVAVMAGQPIRIRNSDETLHNVHPRPKDNPEFNIGQPRYGMESLKTFDIPELMIPVGCDVHPWMKAFVSVLSHPYFSVTAPDGSFRIFRSTG